MPIPKSNSGEMPFLDHLEELRWRIIYSLGSVMIVRRRRILGHAPSHEFDSSGSSRETDPAARCPSTSSYFTHPGDKFSIALNTAMTFGLVLAAPVILYQLWLFLAPALHQHEKRVGDRRAVQRRRCCSSPARALAYFVVVPLALPWLLGFGSDRR